MKGVIWSKRELERPEILQEDNSRKIWGDELPKLFRTPLCLTPSFLEYQSVPY